jgi:hypothetical protein
MKKEKWNKSNVKTVYVLAVLGATEEQIAQAMDISPETLEYWKKQHPAFLKALNEGKSGANVAVAQALYRSATGYTYEEESAVYDRSLHKWVITKTKKFKEPDNWSAVKWLKLRIAEWLTAKEKKRIRKTK